MILDLDQFVAENRPRWKELEQQLDAFENDRLDGSVEAVERLFFLYERASADLARLSTFAAAPTVKQYLEGLVSRAYGELHEGRKGRLRLPLVDVAFRRFPRAFRRHARAFGLATLVTLVGALFGAGAVLMDPSAKGVLMPFGHLLGDPSERVAAEERDSVELSDSNALFSAQLISHNIRVAIFCFALGMTFGIGTIVLLFYNGIILGAVCFDYLQAGEGVFLAGWLLPHGSVEIPAILLAGQAGFVLARALLAGGRSYRARLAVVRSDLVSLLAGLSILLIWAGLVESFLSQTHEPAIPYAVKIGIGLFEVGLLAFWLVFVGREPKGES